jgi:tRNA pseudouridine38-40 synthase
MGETRRLKLIVSYNGRDFAGWQSQKHGNTIQDRLEESFAKICGRKVSVTGAGRTDAGVHALGQCAHADLPVNKLSAPEWLRALNGTLPLTIRILRIRFVSDNFHARFSARAKLYRYRIFNAPIVSPFELGRAWHVARSLNLPRMKESAALFVGRHDFAAFAASRGKVETDTVRTVESVHVTARSNIIAIEVWGEGFLYKMVRIMVGALVRCALGKEPIESIASRLATRPQANARRLHGSSTQSKKRARQQVLVAPAEGLYLVRIRY